MIGVRAFTAAAVTAAAITGCGSDASQPAAPAAAKPASKAANPAGSAAASAAVVIKGFTFRPKTVTVSRGAKVTWANRDSANHNVTFDAEGPKDIGNLRERRMGTVKFGKTGTFAYVCTYHPGMAGTVVVR